MNTPEPSAAVIIVRGEGEVEAEGNTSTATDAGGLFVMTASTLTGSTALGVIAIVSDD